MTTENDNLEQAREWARLMMASRYEGMSPMVVAAAEIIQSLPDQWVDASTLRTLVRGWRTTADEGRSEDYAQTLRMVADDLEQLLPFPPVTLAEIKFGGHAMHGDKEVLICSAKANRAGKVEVKWESSYEPDGAMAHWVYADTLTAIPEKSADAEHHETEVKPPKPMTARILRDHLTKLIEMYPHVTNKPVMLTDTWEEIVNSSIVDGSPVVETFRATKRQLNRPVNNASQPQPGEAWRFTWQGKEVDGVAVKELHPVHADQVADVFKFADETGTHRTVYVSEVLPLHRLVPEQQPRELNTEEDYRQAPAGTVAKVLEKVALAWRKDMDGRWGSTEGTKMDNKKMALGMPRTVIWEPKK